MKRNKHLSMNINTAICWVVVLGSSVSPVCYASTRHNNMIKVPAGSYVPFFKNTGGSTSQKKTVPIAVQSFSLDKIPVTNSEFLDFVRSKPEWRRSKVPQLFAEKNYLLRWQSDLSFGNKSSAASPVTEVSWFAAAAYCKWLGKRLPTVDEWEYTAWDAGRGVEDVKALILAWYSKPAPEVLPAVGQSSPNGFGTQDLHGLIWEWTRDFNSSLVSEESRNSSSGDGDKFCGNGGQDALDASDYANFMRYSFRNSLKATYTISTLGFRCAEDAP